MHLAATCRNPSANTLGFFGMWSVAELTTSGCGDGRCADHSRRAAGLLPEGGRESLQEVWTCEFLDAPRSLPPVGPHYGFWLAHSVK
jgi:hypothetical protein